MLQVIDLAPRGEDGMVLASVEESESSARSTSSGRHSAALPIVGPPRGLLARVSREEKSFSGFLKVFCYNTLSFLTYSKLLDVAYCSSLHQLLCFGFIGANINSISMNSIRRATSCVLRLLRRCLCCRARRYSCCATLIMI